MVQVQTQTLQVKAGETTRRRSKEKGPLLRPFSFMVCYNGSLIQVFNQ